MIEVSYMFRNNNPSKSHKGSSNCTSVVVWYHGSEEAPKAIQRLFEAAQLAFSPAGGLHGFSMEIGGGTHYEATERDYFTTCPDNRMTGMNKRMRLYLPSESVCACSAHGCPHK